MGLDPSPTLIHINMTNLAYAGALRKKGWTTDLWHQLQLALPKLRAVRLIPARKTVDSLVPKWAFQKWVAKWAFFVVFFKAQSGSPTSPIKSRMGPLKRAQFALPLQRCAWMPHQIPWTVQTKLLFWAKMPHLPPIKQ